LKAKPIEMKINRATYLLSVVSAALAVTFTGCKTEPNGPGYEYMPDMFRSPAIEAYVDYGMDPFHYGDSLAEAQRNTPSARKPVDGTIAFASDPSKAAFNMPYQLPNTPEGYELSANLVSPLAGTEAEIAKGKIIYEKYCTHCHGKTGKGDGKVVTVGNHPPPGAYDGPLKDLPEGKMFHTLTYGKGMMGQHASQLNKEELWHVIAYVKTLQGKKAGMVADTTATVSNQ
jgi:mono/diheme cytochrome c family protein